VPELRRNPKRCDALVETLTECPEILSVHANPATASVIVEHADGGFEAVVSYARDHDLFEIQQEAPGNRAKAPGMLLEQALTRLDGWVRSETAERSTLGSIAITGLVLGAVWQTARGQLLPAATSLVWYALSLAPGRTREILRSKGSVTSGVEHDQQLVDIT
jgi:Heavy metal associated domain 2